MTVMMDRRGSQVTRHGVIVGESRDKTCWMVKCDEHLCPIAFHKSFCRLEEK